MFERLLLSSAVEVGVDKGGRMPLPDPLAAWAGLEEEAVVLGASGRIEVWSPARWQVLRDSVDGQFEELAERFFRLCCGRGAD
jgi:MraZ protein